MTKEDREKFAEVVAELKKAAEASPEDESKKTAEQVFAEKLVKTASVATPGKTEAEIAQGILQYLNKDEENNVNLFKQAGVNAPLVGSLPGVDAPGPDEPTLGKTVTTSNEVEKGLVGKEITDKVDAIIQAITAAGKSGGAAIIVENAPQAQPVKAAELEKAAAEAQGVLRSIFEKYAEVSNETEANEAAELIYKYASVAEDILEDNVGVDNYTPAQIEKVACALIDKDNSLYAEQLQKEAELNYVADRTAEVILQKMAEHAEGQDNLEKEASAIAEEYVKQAGLMLDANGKEYNEDDLKEVANYLIDQDLAAANTITPAQEVISKV